MENQIRFKNLPIVAVAILCLSSTSALAQAPRASGDYTKDLPSVQRVETVLKGSDPTDTLARQAAIFEYLQQYIQRIKEARDYRGPYSPGEQKLLADYAKAGYELTQSYTKTHTPAEVTAFNRLKFRYEINNALNWIKQLEGQQAADTYKGAEASLAQSYQRNQDRIQQGLKQQQSGNSDTADFINGAFEALNDSPEARRCLELGGSSSECAGSSLMNGVSKWIGDDPNAAPPLNGVVLVGNYHSRSELPGLSFGVGAATLEDCGTLVADSHNYVIRKSGGTTQIVLANEPDNIVLTLRPDGSLSGPGTIPVKGRVIIGYRSGYDCNAAINHCVTTSTPIYQARMDRCTLRQLAFVPPKPVNTPKLTGVLAQMFNGENVRLVTGIRMTGLYVSSSGLKLEFGNDSVIMDCGRAHAKVPYTVESTATQYVVHIQNAGGSFLLAVAPDNTLRGTGSTTVNGRLVAAIKGAAVSFAPHSESCNIGTLSPKGARNTMIASSAPMPD